MKPTDRDLILMSLSFLHCFGRFLFEKTPIHHVRHAYPRHVQTHGVVLAWLV
jgi:hypothetical protein